MNSQQLLYIYFGIGLLFVLYFLFFRSKPKPPFRLNLKEKQSDKRQIEQVEAELKTREAAADQLVQQVLSAKTAEILPPEVVEVQVEKIEQTKEFELVAAKLPSNKEIHIYFVYNFHEWECHEVLGVPKGASLQEVTEKYQQLIKTSDPSTFPFYEAAFEAILKRRGQK